MTLTSGTRLGPYEIVAPLGAGGMGEVYRAKDTKLDRDVAIKVLPESFALDADRVARFTREAKTLASLNHPNIAAIYGIEEQGSTRALVMELVEGEDLSTVIGAHSAVGRPELEGRRAGALQNQGALRTNGLPLAEVLTIAKQIADALEAAHEQGIVHRDLKPQNIKVRADGTVKVLDFGLAKAMDPTASSSAEAMNSPTMTARATQVGMIIGTAAYMSPEQAKGRPVDKRADIWAFGVVLYEMLTGQRAFKGDDISETLASVLKDTVDVTSLPTTVPPRLRALMARCLERDVKLRLRDIGEARVELAKIAEGRTELSDSRVPATRAISSRTRAVVFWGGLLVVTTGVVLGTRMLRAPAPPQPTSTRLSIPLPPGAELTSYPAITRDGHTIAYVAQRPSEDPQLYLRDLDSFDARVVPASNGAKQPFFSPDGKWVAFFAQGQLQKAEVAGGPPVRVADASYPFGGTWMPDDTIVYAASLGSGLLQVPASGGTVKPISIPDGGANGYAHVFPQGLHDGQNFLFGIWGPKGGAAVFSRQSRRWTMVLPKTTTLGAPTYDASAATPRLLTPDQSVIRSASFDPARPVLTTLGGQVLDNVYSELETEGIAWLAVSEAGTVVYAAANPAKTSLVWLGRDGTVTPVERPQAAYREMRISPDGTKAVIRQDANLWVHDLAHGSSSPLTSGVDTNLLPVWSRDGRSIVFASNRGGDWDIYTQVADGSRPAEVLLKTPGDQFPYDFAPDGTLLYTEISSTSGRDLWTRSPDGKSVPFRVTGFNEWAAMFSPEAGGPHWVAYASDESGRPEIYVQSYPSGGHRIPVSTSGGVRPVWSPDGHELYFVTGNAVVVARMHPDGTFDAPRKIADRDAFLINDRFQSFSVSPDGQRLLMIHRDEGSVPRQLNVILNWAAGRKK